MNQQVTNKDFLMLEGKKRRGLSMDKIMTILCYVALITVVILPCLMIIYYTFWDGSKIDFEMFRSVLFQVDNLKAMKNTLIIAVFATLFATIVGVFFAWLLGRSDIPLKGTMKFLFSIPFTVPDTEENTGAETKPPASAIICPSSTRSPFFTMHFAGAPMCWDSRKVSSAPASRTRTGFSAVSSFPSYG